MGTFESTQFERVQAGVDIEIRTELAGGKPGIPGHYRMTWDEYWHSWYKGIRLVDDPARVKQYIGYIKEQRRRYGLPLYDD